MLDLYASTIRDADQDAAGRLAPSLPSTFGESFGASLRAGLEFSNSAGYYIARDNVVSDLANDIRAKSGVDVPNAFLLPAGSLADQFNDGLARAKAANPAIDTAPLTPETLDRITLDRMAAARAGAAREGARESTLGGTLGSLAGSLVGGTVDPVNIALLPMTGGGGLVAQAATFAAIGAGGQAVNEAIAGPTRERAVPGSGAEAGRNIVEAGLGGAAFGAGVHAVGTVAGAAFGRLRKLLGVSDTAALPTSVREDLHAATSEAQTQAVNPLLGDVAGETAHADAVRAAVTSLARGEPVDAGNALAPETLQVLRDGVAPILDARARLTEEPGLPATMERLSELQLADLRGVVNQVDERGAADLARFSTREDAVSVREAALPERQARIEQLTGEIEALKAEHAERAASIPPDALDDATKARLAAIDAEAAQPAVPAARRAELARERAQITETLAAANPEHASIAQEVQGLSRAMQKRQRSLDLLSGGVDKTKATVAAERAAIARNREAVTSRNAGRRDAAETELRRAVARLAQEGYGLRLDADQAGGLARRLIGANDADVPAVLRSISEDFYTRPRGEGETLPARGVDRRQWRAELETRIADYARRLGHDLSGDELAGLADRVARARPAEAEAILADYAQRPLTHDVVPDVEGAPAPAPARDPVAAAAPADAAPARPLDPDLVAAVDRTATPETMAALSRDPAVAEGVLRDLDRIRLAEPNRIHSEVTLDAEGRPIVTERPLEDVMAELDDMEHAARELEACVVGLTGGAAALAAGGAGAAL